MILQLFVVIMNPRIKILCMLFKHHESCLFDTFFPH